MSRVLSYVFDQVFERRETVSYREKNTVVIIMGVLTVATTVMLIII